MKVESKCDRLRVRHYDIVILTKMKNTDRSPGGHTICRGFVVEEAMPRKPLKPCAYGSCPNLTSGKYCEEHAQVDNQRYEKYERDTAEHKRRYGRSWKKIRDIYIKAHPLCEMCLSEGKAVEAEQVHHKLPISEGGTNDYENLMALCSSCHSRLHAKRGDRWNRPQGQGD